MRYLIESTIFTSRIDEIAAFYQKVLDCEPSTLSDGMATFQTGTVKLFLHERYDPGEGELPPENHLAIAVKDVDEVYDSLAKNGIQVETAPNDYYWGRSAYLRDPDGRLVELHQSAVDWTGAHPFFAAHCFNTAWGYIEMKERTAEEDELMINLAQASIWHWKQRPDCTDLNLSIGYWQAARVYALAGQSENAHRYGQMCLDVTPADQHFYVGYAYESLARAEMVAGQRDKMDGYLAKAKEHAAKVDEVDERGWLESDLETIL